MALNAAELQVIITADSSQAQAELNNVEGMISGVLVGNTIKNFGEDALGFVGDFISVGATFEEQMTLIDRIIGGTMSHLDELKQKAIDADVRTMFDAFEVTQGMEMLARAGFDATQIIGQPGQNNGLIDAVLNFAGATAESTEVAGRSFAAVARIFQNSGVSMVDIADLMTAAVLRSGKSASEFMTAFQYVGSISQQFGTTPDDIVTVIALMEQLGVRSMSVGTSLRSFYSGIASGRADIEALGISLYTIDDAGNEVLRTLPDIIQQFHKLSTTMKPDEFYAMLEDTFGKPAASGLMTLFTTGAEHMDEFKTSMDGVNDAQSIMDARMNTLRGSLEKFSATWLGLKKVLGDSVSGYIKPIVDIATNLVNTLQNAPGPILQAVAAVIALAGAIGFLGGSMILIDALTKGQGLGWLIGRSFGMMLPMLLPVALGLGAIGLAALALKTNFGGVTDKIKGLRDTWDDFKERLREGLVYGSAKKEIKTHGRGGVDDVQELAKSGFYQVTLNSLAAIRDMVGLDLVPSFRNAFPAMLHFAQGLGIIGKNATRLSEIIKKRGLAAGFRALFGGDVGKDIIEGLGDLFSAPFKFLGAFIRNFDTGSKRFNAILKNLGSALSLLGTTIDSVFAGKWDKAWDAFSRSIKRAFSASVQIGAVLIDILDWGFTTAVNLYDRLKNWIMQKLTGAGQLHMGPGGDFAGATVTPGGSGYPIGTVLLTVGDWAFKGAVEITERFSNWLHGEMNKIFPDGEATPALATGFGRPLGDDNSITIDGIKISLSPGEITWDEVVDWASLASKLLSDADHNLTTALGADRSDAQVQESYMAGKRAGEATANNLAKGISDGISAYFEHTEGSSESTKPKKSIKEWIKTILTYEPIKSDDNTFIDQWMAYAQGFGSGLHDRIIEGLNKGLFEAEGDSNSSLMKNFWEDFSDHIGLHEKGPLTKGLEAAWRGISPAWDKLKGLMGDIKGFWVNDLSWDFSTIDWGGIFEPITGGLTDAWNSMVATIRDQLDVPTWLRKLANGDVLGAVKSLFDGGGHDGHNVPVGTDLGPGGSGPVANDLYSPEKQGAIQAYFNYLKKLRAAQEDKKNIPPPTQLPTDPTGPTPTPSPTSTPEAGRIIPRAFMSFAPAAQTGVDTAGKILQNFATTIPDKLSGLKSGLERIAQDGMTRFNTGLGIGFMGAIRLASISAATLAVAATPPDMWNTGFNVGYNLGAGMAAGMIASLALISAARTQMDLTASGQNQKSQPFNGGSSAQVVEPKQPTVVNQTNHINMDLGGVQGLVEAAGFVANLDRNRQIVTGRA